VINRMTRLRTEKRSVGKPIPIPPYGIHVKRHAADIGIFNREVA